ncbi:MAG: hypothetical protein JWM68_2870 [Verrucomicrobiales bacterium]|nr:hypothetical protein [Verrucomicrobiales bacterium]
MASMASYSVRFLAKIKNLFSCALLFLAFALPLDAASAKKLNPANFRKLCAETVAAKNGQMTTDDYIRLWQSALPPQPPKAGDELALKLLDAALFPPDQTITLSPLNTLLFTAFLQAKPLTYSNWVHDYYPRSQNIRLTGPYVEPNPSDPMLYQDGAAYMTHSRVRIYYSAGVVQWLKNNRKGDIPDGSMIIKEMFNGDPDPTNTNPPPNELTGYAVMLRQKGASKDGWLWYIWFVNTPAPFAQYGMSFCLSCHTSADNNQLTFIHLGNITGKDPTTDTYIKNPAPGISVRPRLSSRNSAPHFSFNNGIAAAEKMDEDNRGMLAHLKQELKSNGPAAESAGLPAALPIDLVYNHVPARPGPDGKNAAPFLTSDACVGCHDASYLQNNRLPMMMLPNPGHSNYFNVSEWSEWNGSLMSQSGRDPVFLAQLEAERTMRPGYKDYISDFCFSCHGAMGQRQLHLDHAAQYFTPEVILSTPSSTNADPKLAKYGALARDGVSCTICHRITPDKLGTDDSFNAQFAVGAPHEIFGPFSDNSDTNNPIKKWAMEKGLGITPGEGKAIGKSALCGSCHTVLPDIMPTNPGIAPAHPNPKQFQKSHEQTTYMEWVNSRYSDEPAATPTSRSCIDCHMPDHIGSPTNKLSVQIANVEDGDFPNLATRASDTNITLSARSPFRRHTLTGINLFTMAMFQQFGALLGQTPFDPYITIPPSRFFPMDRHELATSEAAKLAQEQTVALNMDPLSEKDGKLSIHVGVTNLAGHSFPSGVGFRRAFLQLNVRDATGQLLWSSGRVSTNGVLVDPQGAPLKSEFAENWQDLQPNYDVITRQDQVQVYEERFLDDREKLTTSFLSLWKEIKRNRLLPLGWTPEGKYAEHTRPVELGGKPVTNPKNIGVDLVRYEIPLDQIPAWETVEAAVYYQALPPYYLQERLSNPGENSARLKFLTSNLAIAGTLIDGWKLPLSKITRKKSGGDLSSR